MSEFKSKSKHLIIGVGNPFRHDDGVGPAIIKMLQAMNLSGVDLLDGGTDGLALLDVIAEYPEVTIIDAVNMNAPVGTVRVFTPEEARIKITHDALSTHGFGIAEVLKFAAELNLQTKITIIGVQPGNVEFGEGFSAEVQEKIPGIMQLIKNGFVA